MKILKLEAIERFIPAVDIITIIIMVILFLLVIAKEQYPQRFEDFTSLLLSNKYMVIKNKEYKGLYGLNILLFLVHIFTVSILIFLIIQYISPSNNEDVPVLFLRITTAYTFFILLKLIAEKIVANIFSIDDKMDHYLFQKHSYRNFITLFLIPVILILVYVVPLTKTLFYILLAFTLIAVAFALITIVKKNQSLIISNWFYFILYLCALEIAPYVILFKLITIN